MSKTGGDPYIGKSDEDAEKASGVLGEFIGPEGLMHSAFAWIYGVWFLFVGIWQVLALSEVLGASYLNYFPTMWSVITLGVGIGFLLYVQFWLSPKASENFAGDGVGSAKTIVYGRVTQDDKIFVLIAVVFTFFWATLAVIIYARADDLGDHGANGTRYTMYGFIADDANATGIDIRRYVHRYISDVVGLLTAMISIAAFCVPWSQLAAVYAFYGKGGYSATNRAGGKAIQGQYGAPSGTALLKQNPPKKV